MQTNPRKGWPTSILTIVGVGCIGAGGLIGLAVGKGVASGETSETCGGAFTHAEETMDLYYGALQSAGDGITGAHQGDSDLVTTATVEITRYSELLEEELSMYFDLKDQCIEGD